jgi:hypothetical protein
MFDKLIVAQLVKEFPALYVTRRYTVVFRRACHILCQMNPVRTVTPYFFEVYIILFSHRHIDLPTEIIYTHRFYMGNLKREYLGSYVE